MLRVARKAYLISMLAGLMPLAIVLVLVVPGIRARAATEERSSQTSTRYFTVRDSIEMARFGRVDYEPIFSPDGEYFAVVTSRGIIEKNEVESTLWFFSTEAVRECLRRREAKAPTPKVVARLAAIPNRQFFASYGPIISDVRWTANSKGVLHTE